MYAIDDRLFGVMRKLYVGVGLGWVWEFYFHFSLRERGVSLRSRVWVRLASDFFGRNDFFGGGGFLLWYVF